MSEDQILSMLEAWDGDGVVLRFDKPTGTWMVIALHSSALGPPTGGTRLKVYPGLRDAVRDAMRLAEGMTYKWAGLGLEYGGGKAVLAITSPLDAAERRGLMHRYGKLLETLGTFFTGADLGTSAVDIAHMAERSGQVLGINRESGEAMDPGPFTARGVLAGIKAAVRHLDGAEGLAGKSVLVQGLGGVGRPLGRLLAAEGAEVLLCDAQLERAERMAEQIGGRAVPSNRVFTERCDVFSPCAVGGVLNEETISTLGCRIVAGSANNQLQVEDDADRLAKWGVLYVPDYIVNAGGAMAISLINDGMHDRDQLFQRVDRIGEAVAGILEEAAASRSTPLATARRRVDRLLADHEETLAPSSGLA
ncbi:MAG: Glu/Leu/Phe/Val dehydrogenase dimerization domain-containing protein [Acidobacteriota bacterium]